MANNKVQNEVPNFTIKEKFPHASIGPE